jgi:Helitron helicase-like domain at N-terminus
VKIEANNLNWIRRNQQHLRCEEYEVYRNYLSQTEGYPSEMIGRPLIMPTSFAGGPRAMQNGYHNAMSIVKILKGWNLRIPLGK